MSVLSNVISNPTPSAPKGIIYAGPGVGKTTFAASPDQQIILDCENGAGSGAIETYLGKAIVRSPYLETWAEIENWLTAIQNDKHDYRVVAIDTIDWLLRRLEEHVAGTQGAMNQTLNKSHGGYGNGKQVLKNYIYRCLLPMFDRIVNRGIALLLLAHAKRTDITDTDGITVEKTAPDLQDEYLNTFVEWADFVCLARKDVDGNRTLLTAESNRALAKNRYGMTPEIEFSWGSFTSALSAGIAQTKSKK